MSLNQLSEVHRYPHTYPEPIEIPENDTSISSSYSGGENGSEEDLSADNKVPGRNARRKSMAPKRIPMDDEDFLDIPEHSPANSITSVNSLASLLKEKMQSIPSVLKKKQKSNDIRLRAFVAFLFISVVCIVSVAYVLYQQKILQKAYFDRIKFNKLRRTMKIFNGDGVEIIRGTLGTSINRNLVYNCLQENERDDGTVCFEWMHEARLYLSYRILNDDVRCYNLNWISLAEGIFPTDCYDWGEGKGHWYGGGQTIDTAWPLEKISQDFSPFVTGDGVSHNWGNVLTRYFISSKGAAFLIDNESPLHVSINANNSTEICFQSRFDDFSFINHKTAYPQLNYSVCTSSNMKTLHSTIAEKSLWDGLKQEDIIKINSFLSEPVWQIAPTTKTDLIEATIYNYTEDVIGLGFLKQGHVLINEFWQEQVGDFTLDEERFQTLEDTVNIIHRRGFRIVLSIQPFVSTESFNFVEGVRKKLFIMERLSDREIPALTRYKSLDSAGVLDFTKNETIPWLRNQLENIKDKYMIDEFYLDLGTAFDIPHYYQCSKPLTNPDEYKTILMNNLQGTINIIGISSAIQRPRAPIFVSLPPMEASWKALKRVIPTILTYGIIGYPFIMPGAVGGDFEPKNPMNRSNVPDKELYIRWFQLSSFLPVIRFIDMPSKYGDDVVEMAKRLTNLRQQVVTPLMKKYARESLDSGLPIIRPLWMVDPTDPACHAAVDEFSVGDELIVAPVLYPGARNREIYLPAGVWKDGIDSSLRKGSRWIHNYKVLEGQVAYFQKMPDNTRF